MHFDKKTLEELRRVLCNPPKPPSRISDFSGESSVVIAISWTTSSQASMCTAATVSA
jgi:hypothetical protein